MDPTTQARYDARAQIAKAIAHPSRLFILDELTRNGERCVGDLAELIGADISTVSRHLSMLRGAGLIETNKQGTHIFYRIRCRCVTQLFDCIEHVVQQNRDETVRVLSQ